MNKKEVPAPAPAMANHDMEMPAEMSERRKAAIASLIAAGEVSSIQHARFMAAAGLIKLPD